MTSRAARIALAAALAAPALAGCVIESPMEASGAGMTFPPPPAPPTTASGDEEARDVGTLRAQWPTSVSARYASYLEALRADGGAEDWIDALDAHLALPEDIRIVHTECGVENAYYSPTDKAVVLCWELLDLVAYVMQDPDVPPEDIEYAIGSAWLFVIFHELGHALVDVYDLPITGREEDAVDDLATITLIDADAADAAVAAAVSGSSRTTASTATRSSPMSTRSTPSASTESCAPCTAATPSASPTSWRRATCPPIAPSAAPGNTRRRTRAGRSFSNPGRWDEPPPPACPRRVALAKRIRRVGRLRSPDGWDQVEGA